MKILFFANGSSENHGCEAINHSSIKILGKNNYYIGTTNIEYETKYENIEFIQYTFKKKYSILERALCRLHLMKGAKGKLNLDHFENYFKNCEIALSVGGDNYCYGDSDWLYYLHNFAVKHNKPSILWGVSIEDELVDKTMLDDFFKFDCIIVRESISYDTLVKRGLKNVKLLPDPAFTLDVIKPKKLSNMYNSNREYIGINISPLIERKEVSNGIIRENIRNLINDIIDNTEMDVMLIPHVVNPDNNDLKLLSEIKEEYPTERVVLIGDHSCEELKFYISRCKIMIAARTHASIAAYSQYIPTLVIGYSVKSRGIAKDLFGTDENYVIPVQNIKNSQCLLDSYKWILNNYDNISLSLKEKMPNYIKQTVEMKTILESILKKN